MAQPSIGRRWFFLLPKLYTSLPAPSPDQNAHTPVSTPAAQSCAQVWDWLFAASKGTCQGQIEELQGSRDPRFLENTYQLFRGSEIHVPRKSVELC